MPYYTFQVTLKLHDGRTVVSSTDYLASSDEPLTCDEICDTLGIPGSSGLTAYVNDPAPVDLVEYGEAVAETPVADGKLKIWRLMPTPDSDGTPREDHGD